VADAACHGGVAATQRGAITRAVNLPGDCNGKRTRIARSVRAYRAIGLERRGLPR